MQYTHMWFIYVCVVCGCACVWCVYVWCVCVGGNMCVCVVCNVCAYVCVFMYVVWCVCVVICVYVCYVMCVCVCSWVQISAEVKRDSVLLGWSWGGCELPDMAVGTELWSPARAASAAKSCTSSKQEQTAPSLRPCIHEFHGFPVYFFRLYFHLACVPTSLWTSAKHWLFSSDWAIAYQALIRKFILLPLQVNCWAL